MANRCYYGSTWKALRLPADRPVRQGLSNHLRYCSKWACRKIWPSVPYASLWGTKIVSPISSVYSKYCLRLLVSYVKLLKLGPREGGSKMSKKERVIVAMSGGVDSSVAAAMLVEAGYERSEERRVGRECK